MQRRAFTKVPRSVRLTALALASCSVSIGCLREGVETKPPPPPVASQTSSQPTSTSIDELVPPEPTQPFEIVYFVDRQLWRIDPDGTDARSLGYEPPTDGHIGSDRVGGGTHEPTVSRDGKWLACMTGTNVLAVELTAAGGPKVHALTQLPAPKHNWLVAADVSFSEWSPDSSTLLVLLEEPGYEDADPLPLPSGYQYGFYVVRTDDLRLEHAPQIESYLGWLPDSQAVLDSKYIAARDYQLIAYPIAPGPGKVLQRSNDPYGYSQISVHGEWMAWTASGEDGKSSQIMVMPITGGEARALSPRGKFADIQWSKLAPGGKRAVFAQHGKLMLGEGEGTPVKWPGHSEFHWWDDEHVLTVTDAGLVMMDLQGQIRVLDPAATAIVQH